MTIFKLIYIISLIFVFFESIKAKMTNGYHNIIETEYKTENGLTKLTQKSKLLQRIISSTSNQNESNLKEQLKTSNLNFTVLDYNTVVSWYTAKIEKDTLSHPDFNEGVPTKLAYINSYEDFIKLEKYSSYYNRRWLLYLSNNTFIKEIYSHNYSKYFNLEAIVISSRYPYDIEEFDKKGKIPIIKIFVDSTVGSNITVRDLKEFDYLNQSHNTFFMFYYKDPMNPSTYLIVIAIICLSLLSVMLIIWVFKLLIISSNQICGISKLLTLMLGVEVILYILMTVYAFKVIKDKNKFETLEEFLFVVKGIFMAILWDLMFLIASGYTIIKEHLLRSELKILIIISLINYFSYCLEHAVDEAIGTFWLIFNFSETKNILFTVVLLIIILRRVSETKDIISDQLLIARIASISHVMAISLKMKMMNLFIKAIISYFALCIFILVMEKALIFIFGLDDYQFRMIQYSISEWFLSLFLMYIFFPKRLPVFFFLNSANGKKFNGKVYKVIIPKMSLLLENNFIFDKNEKREFEDAKSHEEIPIVVINPIFQKNINSRMYNNESRDNLSLYLEEIKIGQINKE